MKRELKGYDSSNYESDYEESHEERIERPLALARLLIRFRGGIS